MSDPEFVVAVDFGGTKVDIVSATLDGEIIDRLRFEIAAPRSADEVVGDAVEAMRSVIGRTQAGTSGHCVAAGAVSPGIVLADRIALAPNVPDGRSWH